VPLLRTIFFGQILAKSYNIGQFWVDSVAMAVADCMPPFERKKRKRHNLCKDCQNLACDGLLESPLNFPSTENVSKNQITNWNRSGVRKIPKFHIWNSQSFSIMQFIFNLVAFCLVEIQLKPSK
jgi:hypothetical protein